MDNLNKKIGSLVNVGLGMTLGAHITPIAQNFIKKADVVFVGASDSLVEEWVKTMNNDVRSLQGYYQEGISRMMTYKRVIKAIMQEVRLGKNVCGAFYGHPGVFSWAPHALIKQARTEGYKAHMEPGISAEDCLYADLGLDPGQTGCCHYEATQFMTTSRNIDLCSYLILWQISIAGDITMKKFNSEMAYKQVLVDLLLSDYPENHKVIIYECAVLPVHQPRIETITLDKLATTHVTLKSTLIIPPIKNRKANEKTLKQLANIKSL